MLSNSSNNTAVKLIIINNIYGDCNVNDPPSGCLFSSELSVLAIESSDGGEYMCNATNKVGSSVKNATLTVQGTIMILCKQLFDCTVASCGPNCTFYFHRDLIISIVTFVRSIGTETTIYFHTVLLNHNEYCIL